MVEEVAPTDQEQPEFWEQRVIAAYIELADPTASQVAIGRLVGRTDRTIRIWKAHASWPAVVEEATRRMTADHRSNLDLVRRAKGLPRARSRGGK